MAPDNSLGLDQPIARISQTSLLITIWTYVAFALLLLLARIATNLYALRRLQVADGFATLAFALLAINAAVMTAMSSSMYELLAVSVGREQPTADFLQRASYYLKCQFASTLLFWACLWCVKGSFLAFFFQITERLTWPRRAWWAITTITVMAFVGTVISYPLSCTSFTLGACSHPENVRLSLVSLRLSTALDILTDICIIALPLSMVARVRVSKKQKVGLFVVLSLGVFIIGVAIARIIVTDTQGVHPEISWLALWSTVESSVAVIVCCLASFKALFRIQRVSSRSQPYYAQGCGTVGSQGRGVVLTTIEARDDVRDRGEFDTSSQVEILKDAAGMGLNRHDRLCKRNGSTGEARVEPRI